MSKIRSRKPARQRTATTIGAAAWISSIQYFFVQWWVASTWPKPYSPSVNFISDLGNTACGNIPGSLARYVCSPDHYWMNISFTLLGITTALGAILLRPRLMPGRLGLISTSLFVASGIGIAMVGQNPENIAIGRHIIGAYLDAYGACLAIIFMGLSIKEQGIRPGFGMLNILTGTTLLALVTIDNIGIFANIPVFALGLGQGGMEKLCNYLIYSWLILNGYLFMTRHLPISSVIMENHSDAA